LNFNARDEAVRGYLIIGVFFVHALWDSTFFVQHWWQTPLSFALAKLAAPYISIYFFLSGMSARNLRKKSFRSMLPQSLMLILTAWASEGFAIILQNLLFGGFGYGLPFIRAALRPMLYGTGGCNFVTWFFTTLAVVRILGWVFVRDKFHFLLVVTVMGAFILGSIRLHLPDNLYEWRNWPMAALFFIGGMVLPKDFWVPRSLALVSLVLSFVLLWFNAPDLWTRGPCLTCHVSFAAQPMLGRWGSFPLYVLGAALGAVFLLWGGQDPYPAMLGKVARFFGRASLQFLLLHGWLLVMTEVWFALYAPRHMNLLENALFLLAVFVANPILHALVFRYTAKFLNNVLARCFGCGRLATDWCYGWFGAAGARQLANH
jgi:hypothetical protein